MPPTQQESKTSAVLPQTTGPIGGANFSGPLGYIYQGAMEAFNGRIAAAGNSTEITNAAWLEKCWALAAADALGIYRHVHLAMGNTPEAQGFQGAKTQGLAGRTAG